MLTAPLSVSLEQRPPARPEPLSRPRHGGLGRDDCLVRVDFIGCASTSATLRLKRAVVVATRLCVRRWPPSTPWTCALVPASCAVPAARWDGPSVAGSVRRQQSGPCQRGCCSCACCSEFVANAGGRPWSAPPQCCIAGADGQSWPCRSAWLVAFRDGSHGSPGDDGPYRRRVAVSPACCGQAPSRGSKHLAAARPVAASHQMRQRRPRPGRGRNAD
jgi:hypothetical protein